MANARTGEFTQADHERLYATNPSYRKQYDLEQNLTSVVFNPSKDPAGSREDLRNYKAPWLTANNLPNNPFSANYDTSKDPLYEKSQNFKLHDENGRMQWLNPDGSIEKWQGDSFTPMQWQGNNQEQLTSPFQPSPGNTLPNGSVPTPVIPNNGINNFFRLMGKPGFNQQRNTQGPGRLPVYPTQRSNYFNFDQMYQNPYRTGTPSPNTGSFPTSPISSPTNPQNVRNQNDFQLPSNWDEIRDNFYAAHKNMAWAGGSANPDTIAEWANKNGYNVDMNQFKGRRFSGGLYQGRIDEGIIGPTDQSMGNFLAQSKYRKSIW